MPRRPIIAGNWKMHKTAVEGEALARALIPLVKNSAAEVVVCPPFTALERVGRAIAGSGIGLGAQNTHWESQGAFTGEISPPMLRDLGVDYVIVGHSERRQLFHEDDAMVNRKALAVFKNGMIPIICVGELLEQRQTDQTEFVIARQFAGAFAGMSADDARAAVIAYEPVWAIGTGQVATPAQAQAVHHHLRSLLREKFGDEVAAAVRIQYGGSVKPDNAAELLSQPDIDGALVGGASLDADSFSKIALACPLMK